VASAPLSEPASAAVPRPTRAPLGMLGLLLVLVILAFLVHLGLGSTALLSPVDVVRELFRGPRSDDIPNTIVWQVRLTRALGCVLVGGLLGAVGSAFQALFRNPLAEPYIVGVSSGAAVGGALALVLGLGALLGGLMVPFMAFLTGLASLALVFGLAKRRGVVEVTTLLLAGVVVGALLSAVLSLILLAAGRDTNQVLRWLLGSTTPMYWNRLAILAVALFGGSALLIAQTRRLNAFAIGEDTAQRLGIDTGRLKGIVLVSGTAMTAVAVGSTGIIGFLGLVAPHISRRLLGVDWRWSLLGALLLGSGLLLAADMVAQRGVGTVENLLMLAHMIPERPVREIDLPVGAVTALLGAPVLLILLRRRG
jgi:iron complex transport system permease protein